MLIVQDREKPRPQVGSRLPEVLLGKRASEAVLNEVVSLNDIPGQSARITPQPRDLCLEQSGQVAHGTLRVISATALKRLPITLCTQHKEANLCFTS
jgi:hypothetical protein